MYLTRSQTASIIGSTELFHVLSQLTSQSSRDTAHCVEEALPQEIAKIKEREKNISGQCFAFEDLSARSSRRSQKGKKREMTALRQISLLEIDP